MFLTAIIAAAVIVSAIVSLIGSWTTRRDFAAGRPEYHSVADLTGIWSREELERICGRPDDEDRYAITLDIARRLPRPRWKSLFDSVALDALSIAGALSSVALATIGSDTGFILAVVCGVYQLSSWFVTGWHVARQAEF